MVARPVGSFKNPLDFHYQTLKCNVDLLKIIQLGLTFFRPNGDRLEGVCTWQFNFRFSLRLLVALAGLRSVTFCCLV